MHFDFFDFLAMNSVHTQGSSSFEDPVQVVGIIELIVGYGNQAATEGRRASGPPGLMVLYILWRQLRHAA